MAFPNEFDNLRREIEEVHQERIEIIESITAELISRQRRSPRFLQNPRFRSNWYEGLDDFPEDAFLSNFRITRPVFAYLTRMLHRNLSMESTPMRDPISVDKKIAIALKTISTNMEMVNVAQLFGVGTTSVWRCFHDFVGAVNEVLMPIHLRLPTEEEFREIERKFDQKYQFPMTVGAIDGCHIPVTVPSHLATDYHNYKGWNSSLCLAICDSEYKVFMEFSLVNVDIISNHRCTG